MTDAKLLPQQAAAVTRTGSVGLSAGAGCGKTFVLIERFLHELDPARLAGPGPHGLASVAAITFTKKATGELLERLRLGVRARLDDPGRRSERQHWRSLARRIDAARVATIHGFCGELLRGHAARAGLDPAFSVVDGPEADELKDAAVSEAFKAALARDDAGGDALSPRNLVAAYGLDAARDVVRQWLDGDPAALAEKWDADELADLRAAAWRSEHVPRLAAGVGTDDAAVELLALLEDYAEGSPKHAAGRTELAGLLVDCRERRSPPGLAERVTELATAKALGGKGCWPDDDVKDRVQKLYGKLKGAAKDLAAAADLDPAVWRAPAALAVAFLPLARDAARRYAEAKKAAAQLDQDELLRRGRDLLRDPAVRARVAGCLRLLMVDEFQDTDPVQAEVVAALTTTVGGEDSGKLFLVGDAKQSIYRFRGADPTVFGKVRGSLPQDAQLPLTANFRSRPEILRFINATFRDALPDYEPLDPPPAHLAGAAPATRPCVEFLFPAVPPVEGAAAKADDLRETEAAWIAARVRQLVDSREPCVRRPAREGGGERPAEPGDVCLLFRSLSNVRPYEEELRKQGLDYYLVGGKAFFTQQEVHDLIHLLLWLDDPDDTLSLAGVLRSPLCGLSDDTLFALAEAGRDAPDLPRLAAGVLLDLPVRLDEMQAERLAHARSALRELAAGRDRLSPADLLDRAVARTGYDAAVLAEPLGDRKLANLRKLQAMARRESAGGGPGLRGFVGRLRESVEKEVAEELAATRAEAANVVRLMTTHKAKGLEFPVVIVCDCDRRERNDAAPVVVDPHLGPYAPPPKQIPRDDLEDRYGELLKAREAEASAAEERRVFYVAATRAADRLILSGARAVDPKTGELPVPQGSALSVLAGAFDPATGEPHVAGAGPYAAPPVLVHDAKPAAAGRRGRERSRGVKIEEVDAAVAGCEPDAVFPLRAAVPPCRPASVDARGFAADRATPGDRDELEAAAERLSGEDTPDLRAFLPPDLPPPVARRLAVRADLPGGPAVTATLPRLHRRGDGWFAVGTAAATVGEVEAGGLPDRLVPLVWAWRRSLDATGGGDAAVLLVPPAGDPRLAAWDGRDDAAVAAVLSAGPAG